MQPQLITLQKKDDEKIYFPVRKTMKQGCPFFVTLPNILKLRWMVHLCIHSPAPLDDSLVLAGSRSSVQPLTSTSPGLPYVFNNFKIFLDNVICLLFHKKDILKNLFYNIEISLKC